jgi:hypothetical protein
MTQAYRHGEIAFEVIDKLPAGLKPSTSKELLGGSHGHPHTFTGGTLYEKKESEYVFGYFVAKNTTLLHAEHGDGKGKLKKAKLPDGVYRLRRGVEFVNGEMKQIVD